MASPVEASYFPPLDRCLAGHERLTEVSAEFIPFLMRKAERIEEYLSQR